MPRYFSEESEKRIADTVRFVERTRTDIDTGGSQRPFGHRPPRWYVTPDISESDLPDSTDSQTLLKLECEVWAWNSQTETGTTTGVQETVWFNYIPESKTLVQVAQLNGLNVAIQHQQLFPISVVQTSGDPGDLTTQCSFKYDVYHMDWNDTGTTTRIGTDIDPIIDGLWQRCEFGAYKAATRGMGWWTDPGTLAIAWLNEVFEVAECEETENISMMWAGVYSDATTYPANTAVTDGPYMMVSNKTTSEKAAPQPLDEPETKIGTVPTWAQVSGAGYEIVTGQRFTWSKGGQLLKVRVYIPAPSGGGGGPGGG